MTVEEKLELGDEIKGEEGGAEEGGSRVSEVSMVVVPEDRITDPLG